MRLRNVKWLTSCVKLIMNENESEVNSMNCDVTSSTNFDLIHCANTHDTNLNPSAHMLITWHETLEFHVSLMLTIAQHA